MNASRKAKIIASQKPFQHYYPDHLAHCYGCGRLNDHGYHLQSYWDDDETVAWFTPAFYHIAIPGYVYGGLIASLIDCHGTGSAAAYAYQAAQREMDDDGPPLRFLTASLHVDYIKPTPLGVELELRGRAVEIKGRKIVIEIELTAKDEICARGRVVAVQVPDKYIVDLVYASPHSE
jgi:acyl-coenzyme A thioesterase PaaI-like protein